jgi:hypothetical protein
MSDPMRVIWWALAALALVGMTIWSSGVWALARAIARAEGYGIPGAIPTERNNPGDLKLPSSDGAISTFATPAEGWRALRRQLRLIAENRSAHYRPTMTIADMASVWTTTESAAWTANVVASLRGEGRLVTAQTQLREILL